MNLNFFGTKKKSEKVRNFFTQRSDPPSSRFFEKIPDVIFLRPLRDVYASMNRCTNNSVPEQYQLLFQKTNRPGQPMADRRRLEKILGQR